jgi:hypothetical protein
VSTSGVSTRLRRALPLVALAVVAVVGLTLIGEPDRGLPLDPRSPGQLGAKAVADVLRRLDADVAVVEPDTLTGPDAAATREREVVLVLTDDLTAAQRRAVSAFADGGGTLVVADPDSSLTPDLTTGATVGFAPLLLARDCDLPALAAAGRVSVPAPAAFEAPDGAAACYPHAGGHWLTVAERGDGRLVSVGGAGWLTNERLGAADNAVLAAALLAPAPGTRVAIVRPAYGVGGDGDDASLTALIPRRLRAAFWQLLIAFGVVVAWRARRLGAPVDEPQPVRVAGSELVVAVGNLLQQGHRRAEAAALLRDEARRHLARRLGVPAELSVADLAQAAAAHGVASAADVRAVLERPVASDADLVALAEHARAFSAPSRPLTRSAP